MAKLIARAAGGERVIDPMAKKMSIFDEQYRVVAIQGDRLVIKGISSGDVLTIINPEPATPLTPEDYPRGKLIALSDPSNRTAQLILDKIMRISGKDG